MKTFQTAAACSLFLLMSACGGQLVEFGEADGSRPPADSSIGDGSRTDALVADGGVTTDGRVTDAADVDGTMPDSRLADGAMPDAALPDGAMPLDAAIPDVRLADAAPCHQLPVMLGAAANFAVLAGSTVTSTGPTTVVGDLGVSPGTAVTGFPPGTIVGMKHAGDPSAAQAIADLTTAYNDAAGRTLCPVTVAGNLGGQTLAPGLYKSTSSLEISSGDLTLDAQGNGDAVFIFQMASTLTTTTGRKVVLVGGAKAANVFWQVGTSATLGSTSALQGTVMANQAVTLNTGAAVVGRVLARIAAVNLDANSIGKP